MYATLKLTSLEEGHEEITQSLRPEQEKTVAPFLMTSHFTRFLSLMKLLPKRNFSSSYFHSSFETDARKPNSPRFTGKTGIFKGAQPLPAKRTVPSPPKVTTKSYP